MPEGVLERLEYYPLRFVPVSSNEPGRLEAIMTRFGIATFALGYYKKLTRKTVLTGNGMVMDFGSGSRMGARYLAKDFQ